MLKRKCMGMMLLVCLLFLAVSCGKTGEDATEGSEYMIYCLNGSDTGVISRTVSVTSVETLDIISELIGYLSEESDSEQMHSVLGTGLVLERCTYDKGKLSLNFDDSYLLMNRTTEVLTRAALVRTFCQIPAVVSVRITVNDQPLTDSNGKVIGNMTADQFIDNEGADINSYERTILELYFANEAGDGLIKVERQVVYNSNISLPKLIVEQLIAGPNIKTVYPTVNGGTKIISVTVTDGVCYVNLDEGFLNPVNNVTAETTVYSLVNSLTALTDVEWVQISIDGSSDVLLRERVNLNTVFEQNRELVH